MDEMDRLTQAAREIREAFDATPIGVAPERCREIVRNLVRHCAEDVGLSDDEIADAMGMSWQEVWAMRKELAVVAQGEGDA